MQVMQKGARKLTEIVHQTLQMTITNKSTITTTTTTTVFTALFPAPPG